MDKNERKKKMRKGLRIVGIVIAVLLVLLLCVYWISQAMVEKVDTYVRLEGIRFAQADYTYNISTMCCITPKNVKSIIPNTARAS